MIRQVYKFTQISKAQRFLIIYAALLLGLTKLGLKLVSFQTLQRFLARTASYKPNWFKQFAVSEVVWAVKLASCYMPGGAKCLARALIAQTILSQSNHKVELRIGATKNLHGELEAHAWVEHNGNVVIGKLSDLDRFIPLFPLKN